MGHTFRANTSETLNQERTVVPFTAPDMCTSCQLFSEILLESSTALSRSSASNSAAFFRGHELKPVRGRGFEGGREVRGPMMWDGRQSSALEEEEENEESEEEEAAASAVEQAMITEKHGAMGEEEKHTGTLTEDMEDSRESDGPPEEVGVGVGIKVQDDDDGGVEEVAAPVDDCGSLVSDWLTAFESRMVLGSDCCRTSRAGCTSSSSISGSSSVSESQNCVTGTPPCCSFSSSSSSSSSSASKLAAAATKDCTP